MLQVIYTSAAVKPFSDADLVDLLAHARLNNQRIGCTGMLLYDNGSFLQALEGEERVTEQLFAKIARDPRHQRVVHILRREVPTRHFGEWQMGFASSQHLNPHLPGYTDFLRRRGDARESANAASVVLSAFRDGRFRSYVST